MHKQRTHKGVVRYTLGSAGNSSSFKRLPVPGYKDIKACLEKGTADGAKAKVVFFEVYLRRNVKSKREKRICSTLEEAKAILKKEKEEHEAAGLFEQISKLSLTANAAAVGGNKVLHDFTACARSTSFMCAAQACSRLGAVSDSSSFAKPQPVVPQLHKQQHLEQPDVMMAAMQQSRKSGKAFALPSAFDLSYILRPEQQVQLQLFEKVGSGMLDYCQTSHMQQLTVKGLLGAGGLCEVHEVELGPAGGAGIAASLAQLAPDSSEVEAALDAGDDCSNDLCTGARMAFKLPLPYTSLLVPDAHRQRYPMRSIYFQHVESLLLKEASIMCQLAGQPGITRCYGVGSASFTAHTDVVFESVHGLLLELGELGGVQQQLTPAPGVMVAMGPEQAWRVMSAAGDALNAVHTFAECVYEDLKPSNIVCSKAPGGQVEYKLVDFSSCVQLQDDIVPQQHVGGTVGYMAPEAAAGQEHSVTADTWSLGALLMALRTGRHPWYHLASLTADDAARRRTYEELLQVPLYQSTFGVLELKFLEKVLNPNWQQRPTAQQLLDFDLYLQYGPGFDAVAADHRADRTAYAVAGRGLCRLISSGGGN